MLYLNKSYKKIFVFFIILFISLPLTNSLFALELVGEGYGLNQEDARKQALAALSESLRIEVKTEFKSLQQSAGQYSATKKIVTKSNLPLLGVKSNCHQQQDEIYCIASLKSDVVLGLYEAELSSRAKKMMQMQQDLQKYKSLRRYDLLSRILDEIEQYRNYETIAMLLGSKYKSELAINHSDILAELQEIAEAAPSIDIAARMLTKEIFKHRIYVSAAFPQGSQEATEFGRILRDKIKSQIKTVEDYNKAVYYFKGEYEILADAISVSYRLVDRFGETLAMRIAKLSPKAYRGIKYQPSSIDFTQLLHEGYVVSNDFRAELNSNRGKHDLLFTAKETIELYVRLNHPGYFYVVIHNMNDNYSYLLELAEASDNRKFVRYVNADQVNRWLSLGKFEVVRPYGVENMQLIASNQDLIDALPHTVYNPQTTLYTVKAASTKDAMIKTRALKPKRTNKQKSAEAALTFTTMEK